jgi:maltooligosyltrehalose trehalohydrolase
VWAPRAATVTLRHGGTDVAMRRSEHGWWLSPVTCRDGETYGFIVDGDGPFPDPRAAFQPSGVHGPSQWIDHARFRWSHDGWQQPPLGAALIYELHIGTFSAAGTFDGAIAHLDHLARLGVTHVELMPVAEFAGGRGWGYDGVHLFAPHHAYGGPDGLKRLVDACHARSMAVLLDVVYNHVGPAGCSLQRFGPYFCDHHRTAWGDATNLDGGGSDEVRRFFCDNALMWLRDYHIDGLRLDAVHALFDLSAEHFLQQLSREVRELGAATGRHLTLIAESDLNDPRIVRPPEAGGFGIDAQWSDDFHHALHTVITGERRGYYEDFGAIAHLKTALQRPFVYDGTYSVHRQRRHGAPATGLSGWRFVVSLQNHDQVGNRARGERITRLTSPGRVRVAAALLLTSPYVPLLFQGEEWGASTPFLYFTDHEAALGALIRDGRRREFAAFGWNPAEIPDPQDAATWMRSKLRWDEIADAEHARTLEWYASLIALRRELPALRDGRYQDCDVSSSDEGLLMMRRGGIIVACNLSPQCRTIGLPASAVLRLKSEDGVCLDGHELTLPPESAAIVT